MNLVWSLLAVLLLSLIAWGAHASMNLAPLFLVFIPYGAFVVFLAGFVGASSPGRNRPFPSASRRPADSRKRFPG
jgi:hypothetical protein